jgi:hypothetical protein
MGTFCFWRLGDTSAQAHVRFAPEAAVPLKSASDPIEPLGMDLAAVGTFGL